MPKQRLDPITDITALQGLVAELRRKRCKSVLGEDRRDKAINFINCLIYIAENIETIQEQTWEMRGLVKSGVELTGDARKGVLRNPSSNTSFHINHFLNNHYADIPAISSRNSIYSLC